MNALQPVFLTLFKDVVMLMNSFPMLLGFPKGENMTGTSKFNKASTQDTQGQTNDHKKVVNKLHILTLSAV